MYQELSDAMFSVLPLRETSVRPFSVSYAQLLAAGVANFAFLTLVYITCFTDILILGPVLTFVVFQCGWCVNEAARELEDPFRVDGNDFSLTDFHCPFINGLIEIDAALVVMRECEEH